MAPGRLRRGVAAVALLIAPSVALAADAPYAAGPWDPATEAAAEAAVARLGARRFVAIEATIVNVVGLTAGVTASVQQVRQAMQDLGAKETDLEVHVE
ncbi:MAG: hypothetical protein DMF82_18650, partial [Acidobacteria bacterium]